MCQWSRRLQWSALIVLLVVGSACAAPSWVIRADFPVTSFSSVSPTQTSGWSILEGSSCVNRSSSSWKFTLEGPTVSLFDNQNTTGFDTSDQSASTLPYRNRIPLFCAIPTPSACTSPSPEPSSAFYCDAATDSYKPNCGPQICIINATIILNNSSLTLTQPVIVTGSVNGTSPGIRLQIPGSGQSPSLNVTGCLSSDAPILVDTSMLQGTPQSYAVLEYAACLGSGTTVGFTPGSTWVDCEKGYSRRLSPTTANGRVSYSLLFQAVDPTTCQNVAAANNDAAIIGGAVGGAVGLILIIMLIIMLVPKLRHKVFPFMERNKARTLDPVD